MSRMGLVDAKAFSLENNCGWRGESSWGMGTNAGFENCINLESLGVPFAYDSVASVSVRSSRNKILIKTFKIPT